MAKISVIMPAYNAGNYIGHAIESVLAQTFTDFELLICDDGSTDNTLEVCRQYADPRLVIYRNEANQGVLKTFNRLLGLAGGSYIALQDADDLSANTRLQRQIAILETQTDVGVVFTSGYFFLDDGRKLQGPKDADKRLDVASQDTGIPASMMLRATVRDALTGWNTYFDRLTSMDRYFILEILALYPGYLIGDHLYFARIVAGSNHRSLSSDKRKLIIHDVYDFLQQQRQLTHTDFLKQKDYGALADLERTYMADRKRMARNLLNHAIPNIDAGLYRNYLNVAWLVFKNDPMNLKQYRAFFYYLKMLVKGKRPEKKKLLYTGDDIQFIDA